MRGGETTRSSSLTHLRPDSQTGAVCAIEGLREACAIINGPTGCKYFISYFVDFQDPRGSSLDPKDYHNESYFFGQPRAPSTYVDEQDYIYGTAPKLKGLLEVLKTRDLKLVGIVNSPGTSLIGDDVARTIRESGTTIKTVIVESSGFTGSFATGFKKATNEILNACLLEDLPKIPRTVNLLGISIAHFNWRNDVDELVRMLKLLGLRVNSVISAGEKIGNLERASGAEINLPVYEEYADDIVRYMEGRFGTPYLGFEHLPPLGLQATERWLGAIAEKLGLSTDRVDRNFRYVRKRCYSALVRASSLSGLPKGVPFAMFGDSSQVACLLDFLYGYLGMYPSVLGLKEVGETSLAYIRKFLSENSLQCKLLISPDQFEIRSSIEEEQPEIILGSSIEEQIAKATSKTPPPFVNVSYPVWGRVTITRRPTMGIYGVLTLVEEILNGLCQRAYY